MKLMINILILIELILQLICLFKRDLYEKLSISLFQVIYCVIVVIVLGYMYVNIDTYNWLWFDYDFNSPTIIMLGLLVVICPINLVKYLLDFFNK